MPLSYLRDGCHKQIVTHIRESRWFESMYTLQGKTWPTHNKLSTLSLHMVQHHTYLTWSTYSNLSCHRQQRWTEPLLPRKMAPNTIHSMMADRSTYLYPVLSWASPGSSGGKATLWWWQITRLTRPINTSMRSVRSILARGGQPIGP
jgi:hypothetical protein